ncbi:MAG: response regulator [Deltaproteobacteria bacterium]|nr:response regulator [Deltaproteobacteria bacterium]
MAKKILVADDSIVIQKSIGITFAQEDFEVKFVSNGEEALSTCATFQPNIVLADVTMPKLGGIDLTKQLKSSPQTQNIPVLLLAGSRDDVNAEKAHNCGASDVVQKPFDSNELLQKVNEIISQMPTLQNKAASKVSTFDLEDSSPFAQSMDEIELDVEIPIAADDEEIETSSFTPFSMDEGDSLDLTELPADALDATANSSLEPENDILKTEVHYKLDEYNTDGSIELNGDAVSVQEEPDEIEFDMDLTPELEKEDISSIELHSEQPSPIEEPLPVSPTPETSTSSPIALAPQAQVELSDAQIENIVTRVFQNVIERIAWEVVPDLAERIIKEEIQRLTGENKGPAE